MGEASVDPRGGCRAPTRVLADPRLGRRGASLGRDRVRRVVAARAGAGPPGEIAPDEVVDAALAELPAAAPPARGAQRHRRRAAHQPRPGAAVRRRGRRDGGRRRVHRRGVDLATGRRGPAGPRGAGRAAAAVPDAEAVHVVNNGAAALVLAATALAAGREIVVSRGELVEIGDGFRLPDLLSRPVPGCARSARPTAPRCDDYAAAIGPDTGVRAQGAPVQLPWSSGFTVGRRCRELATARRAGRRRHRLRPARAATRCCPTSRTPRPPCGPGAALVTASGDKLLGGPQAGLLLGDADLVERLRRHPLARALRVDKLTLAALEATLHGPATPTRTALHADPAVLRDRGERLRDALGAEAARPRWCRASVRRSAAAARPASSCRALGGDACPSGTPSRCGRATRRWSAGCSAGRLLLDLRCVPPSGRRHGRAPCCASPGWRADDARRRHRRARRPRQVDPGPGADRDGTRPVGGGAPPGHDHRPRLRLDRPAVRRRRSPSSTCPGTSGSCRTCSPGSGRCRRR